MGDRREIRAGAIKILGEVCEANGLDPSELRPAEETVKLTLEVLSLIPLPQVPASALLQGALAVLEDDIVFFNNEMEGGFRQYCIAHEAGHHVLHTFTDACDREDIADVEFDDEAPTAKAKVVGYGPRERKEREANLFALELLLPCAAVRKAFVEERLTIEAIAEKTGMPTGFVRSQLCRAVLIEKSGVRSQETGGGGQESGVRSQETAIGTPSGSEGHDTQTFELDPSQKRAAETNECPVLISAGPGTGKTATLIARIVHLLTTGSDPRRILALTFSNKAAQEMRERIAEARPDDAAKIQIMTFHSFGFNLLMKYWDEAGIDKDSRLVDQIDALLMLEQHLSELKLEHYLALYDPMRDLPDVLTAISVAKDELCGPEQYRKFAEEMLNSAEEDDEILKAEKALETARVYEKYQELMDEQSLLDFGDLIMRSAALLKENEDVRSEVIKIHDHILVDEFQDVNRASGILLKLIAGEGKGLWAVGDLRQSIYRWRGASPENIKQFHEDYAGAKTLSLETNYRSFGQIVRLFGEFGSGMIAREPFNDWLAARGDSKKQPVTYDVADRFGTEGAAIAEHVSEDHESGAAYGDQAVICRTHAQLAGISDALGAKGIPVFYLGQLFEREEVRDLLSLIDLASGDNCHALLRIGEFAEYGLTVPELFVILTYAEDKQCSLADLDANDAELDLGDSARAVLATIKEHLEHEPEASAYRILTDYLFSRSDYLRPLLEGDSVADKQKLIAIYQLLGFAGSLEGRFAADSNPSAEFLKYIKRLVLFREQKNLAEIPEAASDLDAVRLLTVHGAKGLEFPSVSLPYLAAGKVPGRYRGEKCPTPPGLRGDPKEDHQEEEECLFFVALSRARDRLHLSRSINYTDRTTSKESPFLAKIEHSLPEASVVESSEEPPATESLPPEEYTRREFYTAELDRYINCAKQYYYRYEVGLKSGDNRSVYQKLHGVVFETLRQVQDSGLGEGEIESFAAETMDRLWEEAEIDGHAYADLYREKAEELLSRVVERFGSADGKQVRRTIRVELPNGGVKVSADAVEETEIGGIKRVVAKNVKTGKQPKTVETKDADAALLQALKDEYPDAEVSVSKIFLTDDSEYTQPISDRVIANRLKKYEDAIDGINRGEFDPDPSDFKCPTCAFYVMCSGKKSED